MKRIISVLLTLSMLFCMAVCSAAEGTRTVLCLDYGDISIGTDGVSGFDLNGQPVTKTDSNGYTIVQKSASPLNRCVKIASGVQSVELRELNIERTGSFDYAVAVLDTAEAEIIISGTNNIIPGTYRAGINIAPNAKATIKGDGTLNINSSIEAGIGGSNGFSNGTLVIESGCINATGGINGYGSGIGGGNYGHGGSITVNGGVIVAKGGLYAAGIGGGNLGDGGNITINGGTVTAIGGDGGASIGGGYMHNSGNIVINGGSVKANVGAHAPAIGNGYNGSTPFGGVVNSAGQSVSLVTFEPTPGFKKVTVNNGDHEITALHSDDNKLYLYLAENDVISVYEADGSTSVYMLNGGALSSVAPFTFEHTRYKKMIIVDDLSVLAAPAGYSFKRTGVCSYDYLKGTSVVEKLNIYLRGDVNADEKLNSVDALYILQCAVNIRTPDEYMAVRADYNNDGNINSVDALKVLQKVVSM